MHEVVKEFKGSSQKVRRAQMLLKADANGPAWTDEGIADAFDNRKRTVDKPRERFVTEGFERPRHGKPREQPVTEKVWSGKHEARVFTAADGSTFFLA